MEVHAYLTANQSDETRRSAQPQSDEKSQSFLFSIHPAMAQEPPPLDTPAPRPLARHSSTLSSTWSNLDDNDEPQLTGMTNSAGPPGLWDLLSQASHYEDITEEEEEEEDSDALSSGSTTPPKAIISHSTYNVSRIDLPSDSRLAQLSVSNFTVDVRSSLDPAPVSVGPFEPPSSDPSALAPDPAFIMGVLQREFGPFTRDGEEEVFIGETDGALLQEATILVRSPFC